MTSPFSFFTNTIKIIDSSTSRSGKLNRQRHGISPVIATTIILAITITLGLSLWSFANSGAAVATGKYAEVVSQFGEYAGDKFVIANMAFDNPSADQVTVWVYNSGQLSTEIESVMLTCKDCSSFSTITASNSTLAGTNPIPSKSLSALSFDSGTLADGNTYEVKVLSNTGAYQTYYQVK